MRSSHLTRILALLVAAALYPAMASSQEWCNAPICARLEGSDLIRIRAPGRLELTFTQARGFGDVVYDLQADPGMLHNLAASHLDVNGIFWSKISEIGDSSSYSANNATVLEVLEASGVRVRVSHTGKHHRYGIVGQPWNDLGYTQTFTVYATGEVFVDYTLDATRDIELQSFTMVVKSTGDWGPFGQGGAGEAHCVAQHGTEVPYGTTASSFAMVTSNGSLYFADMLMAMYSGIHNGAYWNEGFADLDFRCGLFFDDFHPTLQTGTSRVSVMMRIAQDMNDAASAATYADAYRQPDMAFQVIQGTQVLDDPGDFDDDGFNETEGAYVLRRQVGQDVEFLLHAGVPRPNPAFKILDWNQPSPQSLWIDGVPHAAGAQFRASVAGGTLIVQLLGDRNADTNVRIAGEAVQVPALPWLAGALLAAALGASGARRIARSLRTS